MVVVVAASVNSLLTLSSATGEARARFPSAAASHADWTAIRAPDTPRVVPDPPQDARSDVQESRPIATTRTGPAQKRSQLGPSLGRYSASSHDWLRACTERVSTATRKLRNGTDKPGDRTTVRPRETCGDATKQNAIYKSAKTGVTRSMPHRIFHSYSLDGNFMRWSGRWSRRKWRIYVYLLGCLAGHDPATSCSSDIRSPVH